MKYGVSFRCYFNNTGAKCTHYRELAIEDIPKWVDAYVFTHPDVESISIKIWFKEEEARCGW